MRICLIITALREDNQVIISRSENKGKPVRDRYKVVTAGDFNLH